MNAVLRFPGTQSTPPVKPPVGIEARATQILASVAMSLAITLGLFLMMERMVHVEEVTFTEATPPILTSFVAEKPNDPKPKPYEPIDKIETTKLPPPAPVTPTSKDSVGLPLPNIEAAVPDVPTGPLLIAPPGGIYAGPTKPMAVSQPAPVYPKSALHRQMSGTCDVSFSLNPQGQPYNVVAACSDPIFKSSAERAVRRAQFAPAKSNDGSPREAHNMVWPLEYRYQ